MHATTGSRFPARAWRNAMWAGIAALLIFPLAAMQFSRDVNWDAADFVSAAILLVGLGIVVEAAHRITRNVLSRTLISAAAFATVILIWADAAVGVF